MARFPLVRASAVALTLLLPGIAEATNGLKLTAYGPRAAGRGGVDYAYSDDAIGPASNPAGMAFTYGNRFDNNWAVIFPSVEWTNSSGSFKDKPDPFIPVPAFSFGVFVDPSKDWEIAPIFDLGKWGLIDDEEQKDKGQKKGKKNGKQGAKGPPDDPADKPQGEFKGEESVYGGRVRIGFGIFPVTGGKIQIKDLITPGFQDPVDWETDVLTLAVTPSFAFRITDYLSIGLSLQIIHGHFELDGGIAQPLSLITDPTLLTATTILKGPNAQLVNKADLDDAKAGNGTLGISGKLGVMFNSKYFSVGMVYQEKTWQSDYLGRATVDATDEVLGLLPDPSFAAALALLGINTAAGFVSEYDLRVQDFEFPRMFGLGFVVRPHRRFSIGLDYTFIGWKEVMRTFKTRLSNPSNPNLRLMAGNTIHVRVPLNFKNQHVIAVGISALLFEGSDIVEGVPSFQFVWRMGYNFGKNPSPSNTALPQQPVTTEHHVSGGFTFHIGPLIEFNLAVEYALPKKIKTGVHVGDVTNLSNSEQETSLLFIHFGLGFNF